ncbi:LAQU0S12e02938g1_1 [Lachancea quebecensis]|uniref:E3 ubiquitin-protein ligase listerin n=1 Tax=Lachancea quebecensis TaxID=1654605 RepID=A0A0P1KVH8_9SACH|nr:LAQU0S12e02938g1_1 [Lachancea quebecensis]
MSFGNDTSDFGLGNNGVKITVNYFDGLTDQSLVGALGSVELQLIFKSLLKRDETTKERAVNELLELMKNPNGNKQLFEDECFALCWSQIYAKLITNESRVLRISAHAVTTNLIKIMGKKGAKFLKDFVPLLLSGSYDHDATVAKACTSHILECFGNDDTKVNALWTLFLPQILSFVKELIVVESQASLSDERYVSKQESELKYIRVVTSAICVLIRLTKENANDSLLQNPLYQDIISSSDLWKLMSFKTLHTLKTCESLLSLAKTLWDLGFLQASKDVLKPVSKRLLKAISQISSKNVFSVSPIFPDILSVMICLSKYKNGKFLSWDKSSREKIRSFLLLGPGNADSSYYHLLLSFYEIVNPHLDLGYETDWIPIWRKDLQYEKERRGVPARKEALLNQFWINYLKFTTEAPVQYQESAKSSIADDIIEFLNEKSITQSKSLINVFSKALPFGTLKSELISVLPTGTSGKQKNKCFTENLLSIAFEKEGNKSFLKSVAQLVISTLQETPTDEISFTLCFFDHLIQTDISQLNDEVLSFLEILSNYITEDFYGPPFKFSLDLTKLQKSTFLSQGGFSDALDQIIQKFLLLDIPRTVKVSHLTRLDKELFGKLFDRSEDLQDFKRLVIDSFDFSNADFYQPHFLSEKNILKVYELAVGHNQLDQFCSNCAAIQPLLYEILLQKSNLLGDVLFEDFGIVTSKLKAKVLALAENNETFGKKAALTILKHVKSKSIEFSEEFLLYVEKLISISAKAKDVIFFGDLYAELDESVPFLSHQLTLSSALGLNVHFLDISDQNFNLDLCLPTLRYAQFIDNLLKRNQSFQTEDNLLFLTIASELASDYNFFSAEPLDHLQDLECVLFKNSRYNFDFRTIVDSILNSERLETSVLKTLTTLENISDVAIVYNCRVLHKMFCNAVDLSSPSDVKELAAVDKLVTERIRAKSSSGRDLLIIATLLLSVSRSDCFTESLARLRTYLASELIGAKGTEMINRTPKVTILLNDMLMNGETRMHDINFIPIAHQRLRMVLTEMGKWFDSDLCYEESFIPLRLSVLNLLTTLLKYSSSSSLGNLLFDLSIRVLKDCFEVLSLDEVLFSQELSIYSVQLYRQLIEYGKRNTPDASLWRETEAGILEIAVEVFLMKTDQQQASHFTFLFYRLLIQVFSEASVEQLLPSTDSLLKKFLSSSNLNIDQARLIVLVLRRSILAKQQDLLIEYELNNASKSTEDEPNDTFHFPPALLTLIDQKMPQEYLEYENEDQFLKYLWCCYLALSYLKDISYNLRQSFISQLKEQNLITKLYDFIADQLNLEDKSWIPTDERTIEIYDVAAPDSSSTKSALLQECKELMLHLLYVLFKNMGSMTSSWWLNLKDRSLQAKVEKFATMHVSKLLIRQELKEVSEKVKKLTSQDDSLSIRLNSATNEIKAGYLVDEQKLEISLKIPSNYPLSNIQIQGNSRVGINEQKWKSWILSAQRVIVGMNGSVMDSLELFTKNVNLHFSGFEECAICYSILHAVDRKLPSKVCPTCNNRFHGACLYKWFRSSGNNTCPLCRSEIPFRR